jgi:hypothetical protein
MTDPVAVLTTAWTLACSFQGSVTVPEQTSVKLRVAGHPVLLRNTVSAWTVAHCQAQAGSAKSPCASVGGPTAGVASRLFVGDQPVLLTTFNAPSVGSTVTEKHTVSVNGLVPAPDSPLKVAP